MRGIIVSSIIIVIKRERDYEKKGDVKKKSAIKKNQYINYSGDL